ncbi:MAG: M24 family metallopeptidase [Candidatus Dormibacteria bacterium]
MSETAVSTGRPRAGATGPAAELLFGSSEQNANLLHVSGFLCPDPFVHLRAGDRELICVSALEEGRARAESRVSTVTRFDRPAEGVELPFAGSGPAQWADLIRVLLESVGTTAAIVDETFPMAIADHLRERGVTLTAESERWTLRRRVKTEGEIEKMQRVQQANERAVTAAIDLIRRSEPGADGILQADGAPLTSERLKRLIATTLLQDNCQAGDLIVASGRSGYNPHDSGSGPIRAGEPIIIDSFPMDLETHYHADMTRTVVKGEPDPELLRMHDAVTAAFGEALEHVHAGASGRDVHNAVCRTLHERGFRTLVKPYDTGDSPAWMNHGTGHGLGLEVHEAPRVSSVENILVEGDVITIEPGLYHPELGGIRIEDVVVVTRDGFRNLMTMPKEFIL